MRTDYCGKIKKEQLGKEVVLYGWVNKTRNLGGVIFIDLRDISGLVQIVIKPDSPLYPIAETIKGEYVLEVKGMVLLRESPNSNLPTGEIEVEPSSIEIINKSLPLPIDSKSNDEMRLKYRYLDLRRAELQEIFKLKSKAIHSVRTYLEENDFIDCETPILAKSTPEGARDYLVPSRIFKGSFYALPQSPQVMKQLLMVAGFDRYYQIAKCFRDEDLRADRQPEFSQIDIETSFLNQDEFMSLMEGMLKKVWKDIKGIDLKTPFERMTWEVAMRDYGSDKPDTRFDMKLEHLEEIFKTIDSPLFLNKFVVGVRYLDKDNEYSRKKIDELTLQVKKHGGENLLYLKKHNNEVTGSIAKLLNDEIINSLNLKDGEILFISTGSDYLHQVDAVGYLRREIAYSHHLADDKIYDFKWIVDFPLFEKNEDGQISSTHHPFTRPKVSDKNEIINNPLGVLSHSYDVVCHGYEVGGGSLRIYDQEIQQAVFQVLNISPEKQRAKFGYLLDAMEYGCPPHGGCAFGVERLIMILINSQNIRDVILFPKTTSAQDLMFECPNEVDESQLKELGIKLE